MYSDHMDGWDWLWMSVVPIVWIVLIGVVVYVAVRLGTRDANRR